MTVLYTKSHRRQPVFWGRLPVLTDLQGAIPAGWCSRCGTELFAPNKSQCQRCRKEIRYEKSRC